MTGFMKRSLLLFALLNMFFCNLLFAQRTLVDVTIDNAAILIGEQTLLHITVTTDKDKAVQILIPGDTLMRGVEVLNLSQPDSSIIDNNRLLIKQDILVTSFDSSLYLLPPFRVIDGTDTISSNQVALKVSSIPVDVDNPENFNDIKANWAPQFVLADYYLYIYGVLFAVFIICLIGYVIQRLRNRKKAVPEKKPELLLPPHEIAIKELDDIKQQKLWQKGLDKEYYTQLTDTIRKYIVYRFGIEAMEMTSGEILDIIRKEAEADSVYTNLAQVLKLSDFVKFAKFKPLPDENDLSLVNAYLFVNQTKFVEIIPSEEETDSSTIIKE